MTFRKDCEELFGTSDLYEIFNVAKKATNAEVKKAYYKQSILWHPDRFSSSNNASIKEEATRKFQVVSKIYSLLSDKEKRATYDENGQMDEDEGGEFDWSTVWNRTFKKVSKEEIEAFLQKYRGSEDEMEDVKKAYLKHKGNMNHILETVIGAEVMEEDRIREIIIHYIEKGDVQSFPKFVNEPAKERAKRRAKAKKEAAEADKALKEIQAKKQNDDIISKLEAKYGSGSRKRKNQDDDEASTSKPQSKKGKSRNKK
ncbi:dnaJ domain-containing protein [Ditylenchus destructor]|nr:dnaJ domain-containing protein [Ditylenchus destructor]